MQPDETPRQPEARQTDTFPPAAHVMPGLGAGECGDAIWEDSACPGETVDRAAPAPERRDAKPVADEGCIRGGRFIELEERRPRPANS
jgi:hypothetical protein